MERSAVSEISAILRQLSIDWALIGALAANRYRASPRLTQDVDLLLADAGPGLAELEAALSASGWTVVRADPSGELLRLRHAEFGPADLLVAGTDYQQQAIRRARVEPLSPNEKIPVVTAEDVIVHKLIAGRYQDLADIEAILVSPIDLDTSYIEQWAEFWEVQELWHELLKAARES